MIGAQQVLRAQGAQALGKAAAQVVPAAERGVEPVLVRRAWKWSRRWQLGQRAKRFR